ncbi:MAG: V/A-type H+-transporting ATPase subunit D [Candidatus Woesearchaeota archaeon]|jgi:V/A-type H+-transporting ATPase subunit D
MIPKNNTGLQLIKAKIKLAKKGHSLLEKKQKILVRELLDLQKVYEQKKSDLLAKKEVAMQKVIFSYAIHGLMRTRSIAYGTPYSIELQEKTKNIMGVRVTERSAKNDSDYSIGDTAMDDSRMKYSSFLVNLIDLQSTKSAITKICTEVTKVKRRVKSLEIIQIPKLEHTQTMIKLALDERERGNIIMLKDAKKRINAK